MIVIGLLETFEEIALIFMYDQLGFGCKRHLLGTT